MPKYEIVLLDNNGQKTTELTIEESVNIMAILRYKGENAEANQYQWKCKYNGGEVGDVLSGNNNNNKIFKLPDYYKYREYKGEYVVTVTAYTNNYTKQYSANYTVVVK